MRSAVESAGVSLKGTTGVSELRRPVSMAAPHLARRGAGAGSSNQYYGRQRRCRTLGLKVMRLVFLNWTKSRWEKETTHGSVCRR
jgi:hypothetical protein